jgi:hypothetical protein
MKQRHIRSDSQLDDEAIIVLRGRTFGPGVVTRRCPAELRDLQRIRISVLNGTIDELSQRPPLVRFAMLTVVRVGDLIAAGLRLEPTGRNPRQYC